MTWNYIGDSFPPVDSWILVRNSAGFYAAVNEVTVNTSTGELKGWVITPEEETWVVGDITHWAIILPPNAVLSGAATE
jgi:hypothetical protein